MKDDIKDLRNYCKHCSSVMREEYILIPTYNPIKEPCFICDRLSYEYEQRVKTKELRLWLLNHH